jgi:hypothetical protein
MNHPAFISGNFDTHFVKNHFDNPVADSDKDELIALFSAWYLDQERNKVVLPAMGSKKAWYMRRKSQV